MLIERKDIDALNVQLDITLDPEDYQKKFEDELLKQGKKVQLKGFRKGKVPKSYLKKAFGKSILAEIVLSETSQSLSNYLRENEVQTLGRPLPSADQTPVDFDPNDLQTYQFKFDLGLEPAFELKGAAETDTYLRAKVKVSEEEINEEMDRARMRMGKETDVEEGIEDNDRVQLETTEVKKEGDPRTADFQVLVNMIGDENVLKALKGGKVGDTFTFNPLTLEKNAKESYVKKHMLGLEDEDAIISEEWEARIAGVKRIIKSELDEEFFKGFFGEGVTTESEAKLKMEEEIGGFYQRQAEALLYRSFQDRLLEENGFELPEDFLKRWLKSEKEEQNAQQEEEISTEIGDEEWTEFLRGLKWTIIRDRLANEGGVEVGEEELRQYFMNSIRQYMGAYGADENLLRHSAERLMQNQEQVRKAYESIKDDKVFNYIVTRVKVDDEEIDKAELETRIEAARQS